MKTFVIAAIMLAALPAAAAPLGWRGLEFESRVSGHAPIKGAWSIAAQGDFSHPNGTEDYDAGLALGIAWDYSKRASVDLKLGFEKEWRGTTHPTTVYLIDVHKKIEFPGPRIRLMLEQEHGFGEGGYRYRGRYAMDIRLVDIPTGDDIEAVRKREFKPVVTGSTVGVKTPMEFFVNPVAVDIGPQIDHVGPVTDFGAHIAFSRPHSVWRAEVQHYIGLQKENRGQFIRLLLKFRF